MGRRVRLAKQRVDSHALLVRRVSYADADLVVTLFTAEMGMVAALARGARRSSKRLSAIEPLHLLRVAIDVAPTRDLATLAESRVERARLGLMRSLAKMEAAGQALRWVGKTAAARTPEPILWQLLNDLLDQLDAVDGDSDVSGLLGAAGLRMLALAGWGLELQRCVRCNTPCPTAARASVDVRAGGLVCRACGAGGVMVRARQRAHFHAALAGEAMPVMDATAAELACHLVERALTVHGKGEAT